MLLWDYARELYDYLLPVSEVLGKTIIGLSLLGLVADVWYLHGAHTIILALVLVVGGLLYKMGQLYRLHGRENEQRYDTSTFD